MPKGNIKQEAIKLVENLPEDAILTNGAGNYTVWVHRFYQHRRFRTQVAPTSGTMGYGLPAAIGAAICAPDREVVAVAGDGCFMMTCQEMATAVHHGLNLTVIVIDNARYGTIRAHQEREYPNRISGTELTNPDFSDFARSFGAFAIKAQDQASFVAALAEARARTGVKLIEVKAHRDYRADLNSDASVGFDPKRIYLFDTASGQRLR